MRIDAADQSLPGPGQIRPSYFWTWRLFKEGYSLEHVIQARQLDRETVFEHLMRAAENSYLIEANWVLDDATQDRLLSFSKEHEGKRLPQILGKIPDGIEAEELLLFLKCKDVAELVAE